MECAAASRMTVLCTRLQGLVCIHSRLTATLQGAPGAAAVLPTFRQQQPGTST
jgi:hypothetical protein